MKISRYNIRIQNEKTQETVLFNTLYGSTVVFTNETIRLVDIVLSDPNEISSKSEQEMLATMRELKFVIDDNLDELEIVRNRKRSGIQDQNRLDITLAPNMDCNFACPYCYEKHNNSNRMSEETRDSIQIWLSEEIKRHKLLFLSWFGGEPLLTPQTLLSFGGFAHKICVENNVSLLSHITTNGYNLTKKLIDKLIGIEVFSYQITLDGPPEQHNQTRILKGNKNSQGTFERIFENIVLLARASEHVIISLRVNFNHSNIHAIPDLLAMFPYDIRKQLKVIYEPIFGNTQLSAISNISVDEISSSIVKYYDLAQELGYNIVHGGLGVGKLAYCYAEKDAQYVINYNGDVFKCYVTDFASDKRFGYIDKGGELIKEANRWNEWANMGLFEEKCEACTFLPLCMGGCRSERLTNGGTGGYCRLVPNNTLNTLKSVAFGSNAELVKEKIVNSCICSGMKGEVTW